MPILEFRVIVLIGLLLVVGNWMSSICVPWLMTNSLFMINKDPCVFIMWLLLKIVFLIIMVIIVTMVCLAMD